MATRTVSEAESLHRRPEVEGELQRCDEWKLRFAAEPAVTIVKRGKNVRVQIRVAGAVNRRVQRNAEISRDRRLVPSGIEGLVPSEVEGARGECVGDLREHAWHAGDGNECAAGENLSVRGQERRRRPTAEAISFADVGPLVRVDANRHEALVNERGNDRIGVAGAIHLLTGATPCRRDRQQNWFAFGPGHARTRRASTAATRHRSTGP